MIKRLINKYLSFTTNSKLYFSAGKDEITHYNLHLLRAISIITSILVELFILLTPLFIHDWKMSTPYVFALAVSITTAVISCVVCRMKLHHAGLVSLLCSMFQIGLTASLIVIDIFPNVEGRCVFIPIFFVALPALFIYPYWYTWAFLVFSDIIFMYCAYSFKPHPVARTDMFSSFVGMVCGLILTVIIISIRTSEYHAKTNYRTLSQIDGLTGLLNKSTSETIIRNNINGRNLSETFILIMMDIDHFKTINDTFGHDAGDEILSKVGGILSGIFRDNDVIGRFGGDEFIILLKNVKDSFHIDKKFKEILYAINQIPTDNPSYTISCSIGCAIANQEFIPYDDLFRLADDALYEAKYFGRNRYMIHVPEMIHLNPMTKYILVVDDDFSSRAIITETFQDEYHIIEASNGQQALNILSHHTSQIALVLLDIYMPDMNGLDVLRFMKSRSHTQRIPVMVVTSDASAEAEILEQGADDLIEKPIKPEIIKLRAKNLLARRH